MKTIIITILVVTSVLVSRAQQIEKQLKPFKKVIVSPRVNLILDKGNHENVRLVYSGIDKDKINISVSGKTLHIYLDEAKKVEKTRKVNTEHGYNRKGIYEGVEITAYVTYKEIESLEVRGKQEITCKDAITADQFKLKVYGENTVSLASLKTEYFKASLYGRNDLKITSGKVLEQKYKLYGENKINTREMKSAYTSTSIFGEGNLDINSSEEVRVNAFGEPKIFVDGGGQINKRLIFGNTQIHSR